MSIQTILNCMQRNLDGAETQTMRDFYAEELAGFKARLAEEERKRRAVRRLPGFIEAFAETTNRTTPTP